jgi:hypothetical protein
MVNAEPIGVIGNTARECELFEDGSRRHQTATLLASIAFNRSTQFGHAPQGVLLTN